MRILLIEDDVNLSDSLSFQLEKEGFTVDTCLDGLDASFYLDQQVYDLVLLDRMLPGVDGVTILKRLRDKNDTTPVILLTALGELQDKITGLDAGADDYLVKPFAFEELMARIRCIARRPHNFKPQNDLTFGDISYQPFDNVLKGNKGTCTLSKKEGDLLEFFLRNKKQTLPRNTLLTKVWGPDAEIEDGNLDNYIHFLRRRLKAASSNVFIRTVRGIGYLLEEEHV